MTAVRATAYAVAFAAVGYLAAIGVVIRWLGDAIDAAVQIDGGLG